MTEEQFARILAEMSEVKKDLNDVRKIAITTSDQVNIVDQRLSIIENKIGIVDSRLVLISKRLAGLEAFTPVDHSHLQEA